jgi:hypothetical protein
MKALDPNHLTDNSTRWRMRAEEMRTLTEETYDPAVRAMMLRMAEDYDRLAGHAEDRASAGQNIARHHKVIATPALARSVAASVQGRSNWMGRMVPVNRFRQGGAPSADAESGAAD